MSLVVIIPIPMPSLDIQEILALLPHRYPMLMVDRIVDITEDSDRRNQKRHRQRAAFHGALSGPAGDAGRPHY